MRIITTPAELRELEPPRRGDAPGRRAVVMTMGALHAGHLALVRSARVAADQVVVTIFVNPLQFNDPGDLESYPRTLEADAALLEQAGVDVLFAPDLTTMYPHGDPAVTVSAGEIGDILEGAHRPGHFDGMLTVVLKLMHLVQPHVAFFGQKDAQQLIAIRAMARDLDLPVQITSVPTVRDGDGLALSSRNIRLSEDERARALSLSRALNAARDAAETGAVASAAVAAGQAILDSTPGLDVDYLAALDPADAHPVGDDHRGDVVIAVAATVGDTRLIDNVVTRLR
ncbi:pantoate--beta-alanine ligase [Demequina zhanjiangensis]|uniref:Pantothenate synthetase n=1 Tax=Demequina zhanjiangensis TaxID=3051659 RepID=A0ABT8FYU3_9MICO|nr:pantoate--beta-alanine ligase [Demequina sp. SYSU T00b26]MDN4471987.1 pantoate--beta-alanine ligase [Demequina sp. SYSU T00b26]